MPERLIEDCVDGLPNNLSEPEDFLRYEQYRLETFTNWTYDAIVKKKELAKNGFYYLGEADRVKCVFCHVILLSWEKGDDIRTEHRKHAPQCPFLINPEQAGNIGYEQVQSSNTRTSKPKHPEYKDRAVREKSFISWPANLKQRPSELACAGFFYLGAGDGVRCFHCGGILRDWDDPDNPWEEHKRWFPSCPFILENGQAGSDQHREVAKQAMVSTAIENGYSEDLLMIFNEYCDTNNIPYPDSYEELVDQLEQLRVGQETETTTQAATGFTPNPDNEVFTAETSTELPSTSQPSNVENTARTKRRKTIQTQWSTDDRFQCKICFENHVEVIFLPCRHVCCCQSCCNKLKVKECPICRSKIKGMQPLYFA